MDDNERQSAFITALTTEHLVLQTAANANTSEAGTRGVDSNLENQIVLASLVGAVVAVVLMAAFLAYQRWRYRAVEPHEGRQ